MKKRSIWLSILGHLFYSLIIIAAVFAASYLVFIWSGYPQGSDFAVHTFRARWLANFGTHYNWIHVWSGGQPYLWYPVLPYLPVVFLMIFSHLNAELSLTLVSVLAVAFSAVGIFFLTFEITRNRLSAFLAAFVYATAPSIWIFIASGGIFARAIATPFMVWAIWAFVRFVKELKPGQFNRWKFVTALVLLSLSIFSHQLMGFGTILILIFLWLVYYFPKIFSQIKYLISLILFSLLLSASFLLPMYVIKAPGFWVGKDVLERWQPLLASWNDLFNLGEAAREIGYERLDLYVLPAIVVFLSLLLTIVLLLIRKRKKFENNAFQFRSFLGFLILGLLTIIYAKYFFPFFKFIYAQGIVIPLWALYFTPLFLGTAIGISFKLLIKNKIWQLLITLLIIGGLSFWFFQRYSLSNPPPHGNYERIALRKTVPLDAPLVRRVIDNPKQFNFRLGDGNDVSVAVWLNNEYPYIPQNRDYFSIGVVVPDYYFYLYQGVWRTQDNFEETNFLLDWWSIKQILTERDLDNQVPGKFENQPNSYKFLGDDGHRKAFEFLSAFPILATTNVSTALVITPQKGIGYSVVLKSLAYSNLNSQYFIPIHGKEYIDDYKLEELNQFKTIVLYEYQWHNKKKADKLLRDYVSQGGGLFIEANKEEWQKEDLLEVFPVSEVATVNFPTEWAIRKGDASIDLEGIDFTKFSPPVFDQDKPWKMVQANEIKAGGNTILFNFEKPVMVAWDYGQGRVIWSGMNLPYHIVTYNNEEESKFLGDLLDWLSNKEGLPVLEKPIVDKDLVYETESYKTEFVNPEKRIVALKKSASGVLFKEAYFRDWHAYLIEKEKGESKKEKLKIYKAGPDFMYVALPGGTKESNQVVFEYKKTWWPEKLSLIISILTFAGLIFYLFGGKLLKKISIKIRARLSLPSSPMTDKVGRWWDDEDNNY